MEFQVRPPDPIDMKQILEISGISERDIDLMLLEELTVSQRFRERLLGAIGARPDASLRIEKAARSATDSTGESDLRVDLVGDRQTIALFIENKVSASFQRDQAESLGSPTVK